MQAQSRKPKSKTEFKDRPIPGDAPVVYTAPMVAKIVGVSERTVREWLSNGTLRYAKIGHAVRITPEMLDELLAGKA